MSVMLTRSEEAMMPKKKYCETGAAVKPDASMMMDQGWTRSGEARSINSRRYLLKLSIVNILQQRRNQCRLDQ